MAEALSTDAPGIARFRRLSGLPPRSDRPLIVRFVRSPWLWATLILTVAFVACLVAMYLQLHPDRRVEGGVIPGLSNTSIRRSALYALPTLAVYTGIFVLVDRWRPQRLAVWYIALAWGGSVATYLSLQINSWAATQLSVGDEGGNQLSGARAAIYIAPFVEEAAKATVLFLIAFLDRNRLVSKITCIAIAGLSAVGFAFTENIVYFARAITYGSYTRGTGNVTEAVERLVQLRGVYTSFGHPLFTAMTAIGVAIGFRSRSKIVRVVAPLAGYLAAALLHMAFNTVASLMGQQQQIMLLFTVAVPLLLGLLVLIVIDILRQGTLIGRRLTDYVRMGWLPDGTPRTYAKLRLRFWAVFLSFWHGNPIATLQMIPALTKLAYLRDEMTRGVVDSAGLWRERELLARVRKLRDEGAVMSTAGLKPQRIRLRRRKKVESFPAPAYPGPAGLAGSYPARPRPQPAHH